MTKRFRFRGAFISLLVLAALLAGCSSDDKNDNNAGGDGTTSTAPANGDDDSQPAGNDVPAPTAGGSLTVGLEADCNSYAPWLSSCAQSGDNVMPVIYDPMVVLTADGTIAPYLAESVVPNDDSTEWTVTLRSGVKFHDGTELTAQVQKDGYDEFLAAPGSILATVTKDIEEVRVDDDLVYTYVLKEPNPQFTYLLATQLGNAFSIEAARANPEDFGSKPVGTGPFKLVSWVRDGSLVAEKNPEYWQEGLPYLDKITFVPLPDEDARQTAMESGDVDVVLYARLGVYLGRFQEKAAAGDANLYMQAGDLASGILVNTAKPPLDDLRVRQGLVQTANPDELVLIVAEGPVAEPRTLLVDPSSEFFSADAAAAYPAYDEEEGGKKLAEYIADPNRSDGKAPGSDIEIEYLFTNTPAVSRQAQYLQAKWGEHGVKLELSANEMAQSIQRAIEGSHQLVFWRPGVQTSPLTTMRNEFTNASDLSNVSNFTDPRIDEAREALLKSQSFAEQYDAVEKFLTVIAEQVPFIMIASNNEFFATRPDVYGLDTWTTPEGDVGFGSRRGRTIWGQVYRAS